MSKSNRRDFLRNAAAVGVAAGAAIGAAGCEPEPDADSDPTPEGDDEGAPSTPLDSASKIAFGGPDTLFIADWKQSRVYAFELPAAEPPTGPPVYLNIMDLDAKLDLSWQRGTIALEDVAVRPGTHDVYIAISVGGERVPVIAIVRPGDEPALQGGTVELLDLNGLPSSHADLSDVPESSQVMFEPEPLASYTVTDMKWYAPEQRLYVTGLSNRDFASTLRMLDYPFTGDYTTRSVEVYHGGHRLWESRAPIRAFDFVNLRIATEWEDTVDECGNPIVAPVLPEDPEPCILAALLCTPLVVIPLAELAATADGDNIRPKTIAEIDNGGTPMGLIPFTSPGVAAVGVPPGPEVLVLNRFLHSVSIPFEDIETITNANETGLTAFNPPPGTLQTVVFNGEEPGQWRGTKKLLIDTVQRMAYLRDQTAAEDEHESSQMVALRRDGRTGTPQLVTLPAGMLVRLTDMTVEEYWFNAFQYPWDDPDHPEYGPYVGFFIGNAELQNHTFANEGYPESGFSNIPAPPPREEPPPEECP